MTSVSRSTHMIFVAYEHDDPNGSPLGVLTEIRDKTIQVEPGNIGRGDFTMNRHSVVRPVGWTTTGNYVKVFIDDTDGDPVFGFWLEEAEDDVLSVDAEGGQVFDRGGRGALAYMQEAILWHLKTGTGQAIPGPDGNWTWTAASLGQVLKEAIDEAQLRGCLPDLTYDFDTTNDSNGDPWDDTSAKFQLPIGMDLLSVIGKIRDAGVTVVMSPDLVLSAYQTYGSASGVTFTEGVNIRETSTREIHDQARSRMLVQGTQDAGTLTYRVVNAPGLETDLGRRKEGFVRYQATPTVGLLDKAGNQAIASLRHRFAGPATLGVLIREDEVPFVDYQPGDTVTVDVPGIWNTDEKEVAVLILVDTDGGECDAIIGFEGTPFDQLEALAAGAPGPMGPRGDDGDGGTGGHTCNDCPDDTPYVPPEAGDCTPTENLLRGIFGGASTTSTRAERYIGGVLQGFEPLAPVEYNSGNFAVDGFYGVHGGCGNEAGYGGEEGALGFAFTGIGGPGSDDIERRLTIQHDPPVTGWGFRVYPTGAPGFVMFDEFRWSADSTDGIDGAWTQVSFTVTNPPSGETCPASTDDFYLGTLDESIGPATFVRYSQVIPNPPGPVVGILANTMWEVSLMECVPADPTEQPLPAQQVDWTPIDPGDITIGSGVTSTTVPYAGGFQPGSLQVTVDGIPILPAHIVYDDPVAGTFHLDWEIDDDETVRVKYQVHI